METERSFLEGNNTENKNPRIRRKEKQTNMKEKQSGKGK
jgi:hypothetical protein